LARRVAELSIQYNILNINKNEQETFGLVHSSDPTIYRGSKVRFCGFPKLPRELKLLIWKWAVPDPRDIDGVMLFITNFDFSNPRAVIPAPHEMKIFCAGPGLRAESIRIWWTEMCVSWYPVLSLLHTCRDARSATLEKFRLPYESIIEGEDQAPWSDSDTIYFPSSGGQRYDTMLTFWLGVLEGWPKTNLPWTHFSSLKHLALDSTPEFKMSLDGVNDVLDPWLKKFSSLESFSLLFDPNRFGRKQRLVLFEAGDGPLTESYRGGRGEVVKRIPDYSEKDIVTNSGLKLFESGPPPVDCTVLIGLKQRRKKAGARRG
jgi:hypothetical protein